MVARLLEKSYREVSGDMTGCKPVLRSVSCSPTQPVSVCGANNWPAGQLCNFISVNCEPLHFIQYGVNWRFPLLVQCGGTVFPLSCSVWGHWLCNIETHYLGAHFPMHGSLSASLSLSSRSFTWDLFLTVNPKQLCHIWNNLNRRRWSFWYRNLQSIILWIFQGRFVYGILLLRGYSCLNSASKW